jgi:hypothetical protein
VEQVPEPRQLKSSPSESRLLLQGHWGPWKAIPPMLGSVWRALPETILGRLLDRTPPEWQQAVATSEGREGSILRKPASERWWLQRDSNPCFSLERAVTWSAATRAYARVATGGCHPAFEFKWSLSQFPLWSRCVAVAQYKSNASCRRSARRGSAESSASAGSCEPALDFRWEVTI